VKLAVTTWQGRVSPLLDGARRILLLELDRGKVISRAEHKLRSEEPLQKAEQLAELSVDALICGAVSRPLAEFISRRGIRLVPFVAGEIEEVIAAYLAGNLPCPGLAMPGCCRRRMQRPGGRMRRGRCCRHGQ
jgi:predicted Fe-Mo cluster-binding NifX family protein